MYPVETTFQPHRRKKEGLIKLHNWFDQETNYSALTFWLYRCCTIMSCWKFVRLNSKQCISKKSSSLHMSIPVNGYESIPGMGPSRKSFSSHQLHHRSLSYTGCNRGQSKENIRELLQESGYSMRLNYRRYNAGGNIILPWFSAISRCALCINPKKWATVPPDDSLASVPTVHAYKLICNLHTQCLPKQLSCWMKYLGEQTQETTACVWFLRWFCRSKSCVAQLELHLQDPLHWRQLSRLSHSLASSSYSATFKNGALHYRNLSTPGSRFWRYQRET